MEKGKVQVATYGNGKIIKNMLTFEKFKFYKLNNKKVSYAAVVLDSESHNLLLSTFVYPNPEFSDWIKIAHHLTICLRELPEHLKKYWLDEEVSLTVTHLGVSDKAIAVKVTGFYTLVDSKDAVLKFPHITLAINPFDAKPLDSNLITDWQPVQHLKLNGVVKEIEF